MLLDILTDGRKYNIMYVKAQLNSSTHIPLCVSYEYSSINVSNNNYTIRHIPNYYLNVKKEMSDRKVQENQKGTE